MQATASATRACEDGGVATPIGRWARRERARRKQVVAGLVCLGCTGLAGRPVAVRRVRILRLGEVLPGVQCPRCLGAWVEQEEAEAPMEKVST